MAEQRSNLRHRMGDKHEEHLSEVLGARRARGSGNQWRNQMDARQDRYDTAVAFAVDGKSTLAKSISITREMLDKAVEQAAGERPMIAIRFYDDERLRGFEDWMTIREDDLLELIHWMDAMEALGREVDSLRDEAAQGALVANVMADMNETYHLMVEDGDETVRHAVLLTLTRVLAMVEMAVRAA